MALDIDVGDKSISGSGMFTPALCAANVAVEINLLGTIITDEDSETLFHHQIRHLHNTRASLHGGSRRTAPMKHPTMDCNAPEIK